MVGNPSSGHLCTRHGVRGPASADLVGDCTLVCKLEAMRWYDKLDGSVTDREWYSEDEIWVWTGTRERALSLPQRERVGLGDQTGAARAPWFWNYDTLRVKPDAAPLVIGAVMGRRSSSGDQRRHAREKRLGGTR